MTGEHDDFDNLDPAAARPAPLARSGRALAVYWSSALGCACLSWAIARRAWPFAAR